jgi:hypothetical protein
MDDDLSLFQPRAAHQRRDRDRADVPSRPCEPRRLLPALAGIGAASGRPRLRLPGESSELLGHPAHQSESAVEFRLAVVIKPLLIVISISCDLDFAVRGAALYEETRLGGTHRVARSFGANHHHHRPDRHDAGAQPRCARGTERYQPWKTRLSRMPSRRY